MTTEEYRNYKILFERCLIVPITTEVSTSEEDPDLYFGSSYEADIDSLENENPKKEPEDEV